MSKPRIRVNWAGHTVMESRREEIVASVDIRHKSALKQFGLSDAAISDLIIAAKYFNTQREMPRLSWAEADDELTKTRDALSHLLKFYKGNHSLEYAKLRLASPVWRNRPPESERNRLSPDDFVQEISHELRYFEDAITEWDKHKWRGPENSLEIEFTMDVCAILMREGCVISAAPKGTAVQCVQILFQSVVGMDVMVATVINWVKAWIEYANEYPELVAEECLKK